MNDDIKKDLIKNFGNILDNLNIEVDKAGGRGFSVKTLDEITALDLLITLAPNKVSFKYTGDKK